MSEKPMNPYAVAEPLILAMTGNRSLAKLAWRAHSVQDIVQIIQGTSPIIDHEVRIAREKQKSARY